MIFQEYSTVGVDIIIVTVILIVAIITTVHLYHPVEKQN
jgi:hypothetical protein